MPHVSDVHATSHDRHDPMLVAALAAGDLAATDRDQAIALTRSCAECATLHDDLLALARATASAPPPITTRPRDFTLTPADAARLRPSGWRRLVGALSAPRSVVSRPLGIGLATLGLVGLLVGNVSLTSSSAGAAPTKEVMTGGAAGQPAAPPANASSGDTSGRMLSGSTPDQVPAASDAYAAAAAASRAPVYGNFDHQGTSIPSGLPEDLRAAPFAPYANTPGPTAQAAADLALRDAGGEPLRPLNMLFGSAIVIGLGLLVASWLRSRRTA
jgi:hypothetical protein